MIKSTKYVIILLFILSYVVFADGIILEISAIPQSNSILIKFVTENEAGVKSFTIQKSIGDANAYEDVKEFEAVGRPSEYSYEDEIVWLHRNNSSVVYYKIAILKTDGKIEYSTPVLVMPNVNEIVKTWGSIKLLFR